MSRPTYSYRAFAPLTAAPNPPVDRLDVTHLPSSPHQPKEMDNPVNDIRRVVSELCEPDDAREMVAAVDKYFTDDARFICALRNGFFADRSAAGGGGAAKRVSNCADPLLNSPKGSGKEGIKAAYKMLRGPSPSFLPFSPLLSLLLTLSRRSPQLRAEVHLSRCRLRPQERQQGRRAPKGLSRLDGALEVQVHSIAR